MFFFLFKRIFFNIAFPFSIKKCIFAVHKTNEKAKQKLLTNYSDFTMKKGLLSKLLLALICLAGGSMTALAQTPEPSAKWTFDDTADLMAVQTGAFQMTPISVPISGGGVVASTLGGVGISSVSGPSRSRPSSIVSASARTTAPSAVAARSSSCDT